MFDTIPMFGSLSACVAKHGIKPYRTIRASNDRFKIFYKVNGQKRFVFTFARDRKEAISFFSVMRWL